VEVDEDMVTVKRHDVVKAVRKTVDIEEIVIDDIGLGG